MLTMLNQHYGPLDIHVIANGRDPGLFVPDEKEPYILAVGRVWDEGKNVGALHHVARDLLWPIYVAGDQKHPDGRTVDQENVIYLGSIPVPSLADWMGRASIYALPARYEPFGLSILEAGLAGCALVLGDIPSLREIWDDCAVFVPPNDVDALRDGIQCLIDDEDRREALGCHARARAVQFTPEKMGSAYLSLYADLIARNNRLFKN
jgi:glycosyltransferase involved in cell wall biosynthesis